MLRVFQCPYPVKDLTTGTDVFVGMETGVDLIGANHIASRASWLNTRNRGRKPFVHPLSGISVQIHQRPYFLSRHDHSGIQDRTAVASSTSLTRNEGDAMVSYDGREKVAAVQ